ncbi:MAG TPA: DUF3352 domain-containing protein [Acidimicrobiales bacterium]|nr:DUF3352 domain-containing protein [Acidimicrobiales bacterium]
MRKAAIATALALLLALPACGGRTDEKARAAGITPANALGFLSVSLDPSIEQKRNLLSIARRFPDAQVRDDFEENRDELLSTILREAGLDYERDVKPWLGSELAVAVLPGTSGPQPLVAVLIEQDDEDAAKAAIDKANAQAQADGGTPIAYRVLDDFVVATDGADQALAQQTLDAFTAQAERDEGDLSRSKEFADVVDQLHGDRLLLGWVDGKEAMRVIGQFLDAGDFPVEGLVQQATTAAFDVHAARSAVVLEAVGRSTAEGRTGKPALTEGLPQGSYGAFTIFDIGQTLREGLRAVFGTGGDPLAELRRQTGIDVERDLLSWMGGESVLVAAPGPTGQAFPQVGLVVEPTDRAAAEAAVPRLRQALQGLGSAIGGGVQPAIGLFDDRVVIASSPAYMEQLSRDATPSFGESDVYRSVLGEQSSDATRMQFVLDIDAIRATFEAFMPASDRTEYEQETKRNVEPFDAVGLVFHRDGDFDRVELTVTFD